MVNPANLPKSAAHKRYSILAERLSKVKAKNEGWTAEHEDALVEWTRNSFFIPVPVSLLPAFTLDEHHRGMARCINHETTTCLAFLKWRSSIPKTMESLVRLESLRVLRYAFGQWSEYCIRSRLILLSDLLVSRHQLRYPDAAPISDLLVFEGNLYDYAIQQMEELEKEAKMAPWFRMPPSYQS